MSPACHCREPHAHNRTVLAGGPGAGKSSVRAPVASPNSMAPAVGRNIMSETPENSEAERQEAAAACARADRACTFGPSFFLGHLGRFVRDHCPSPRNICR